MISWTEYQEQTRRQRDIAWAAATDAGTRHMITQGRTQWNDEDWTIACIELDRLLG